MFFYMIKESLIQRIRTGVYPFILPGLKKI